jgi:hypothetical protein
VADYLVLEAWKGIVNERPVRFAPGTIICDGRNNITALRAEGCALAFYTVAHLGDARAAYLSRYGPGKDESVSMLGTLLSLNLLPINERKGVVTAAGAGDEAVVFPELPTPYNITYGVEDTGSGSATVVVKQTSITSTGFTLTVGGAAKFHWTAKTI